MSDKRTKILVGVNTLTSIDQAVYSNHCQLWFRLGRRYVDCDFAFYTPRRASIDRMRNEVAKLAVMHEFDYILFLDDDVLVPHEGLAALMQSDADIAAGWTIIRGYPFDNMFFKYDDEEKKSLKKYNDFVVNEKGVIECDAVGFSFCLIKVSLLKNVPTPYFVTGPFNTEDVYFCIKARVHNPDCTIIVDPNVKTGHCLGSEFIDPSNREQYIDFFKKAYPDQVKDEKPIIARGDGYLKMVEEPTPENIKAHIASGE
jgi:hypothetical protein